MLAPTISQDESIPSSYPTTAPYSHWDDATYGSVSGDTNTVASDMIWQRLEAHIAYRWTPRNVTWIVEGPGEWKPPLTPTTVTTVKIWAHGDGWQTTTLEAGPMGGYVLPGEGPYQIIASVGSGTPPEAVQEAYRRLYEYSKGIANQYRADAAFLSDEEATYASAWAGKAIQLSGAADLLRPYRKA